MSCAVGSFRRLHCRHRCAVLAVRFLQRSWENAHRLRRLSRDVGQGMRAPRPVKKRMLLRRQLARLYQWMKFQNLWVPSQTTR